MGCRCETIELGGSELGSFLGGSLPPQFPPLRIVLFWIQLLTQPHAKHNPNYLGNRMQP